ncbi:MAG TPA: hypothetical protein VHD76_07430 [Bryobacteraceae bacterium]|nr:hypothetical protein [Bryobacteraceae bacterium]
MRIAFVAAICCAPVLLPALRAEVVEKDTVRKSFSVPASGTRVEVDNVWGSIDVAAYSGSEVRIVAEKTLSAEDAPSAEEARREVKLDLTQSASGVKAYVDGPFRCHCEGGRDGFRGDRRERRYRVQYDFRIEVPVNTSIDVSTVNDGKITVRGVSGAFDVHNVNGAIRMTGISGAGSARTVNGEVYVTFAHNPGGASSFATLNGDLEVIFQPDLSADVQVKTMHGDVFTDFQVNALPRPVTAPQRKNGHFIYRSDDSSRFRIGRGGPEFRFETLNGSIKIRSRV